MWRIRRREADRGIRLIIASSAELNWMNAFWCRYVYCFRVDVSCHVLSWGGVRLMMA